MENNALMRTDLLNFLVHKNCNINQDAIYSTNCSHWVHRKCNGTSKIEYSRLSYEPVGDPFNCMMSIMKRNSNIFPYFFIDKSELRDLNGTDLPFQLKFIESYEIKSILSHMPNLQDFDMDENLIHKVNSKYYDVIDFPEVKKNPH